MGLMRYGVVVDIFAVHGEIVLIKLAAYGRGQACALVRLILIILHPMEEDASSDCSFCTLLL